MRGLAGRWDSPPIEPPALRPSLPPPPVRDGCVPPRQLQPVYQSATTGHLSRSDAPCSPTNESVDGVVRDDGAGASIEWPDGATTTLRSPAGYLCSSIRTELTALPSVIHHLLDHPAHTQLPVVQ